MAKVGIIGGSGLYDIEGIKNLKQKKVLTPFGKPSDVYMTGTLDGTDVVFLPRHARGHRITPTEIYMNGLSMDEEGNITIDGVSQSMSQVFAYVKSLDDSPMFKDVKTKSTATKKDQGKDVAVFELALKLEDSRKE